MADNTIRAVDAAEFTLATSLNLAGELWASARLGLRDTPWWDVIGKYQAWRLMRRRDADFVRALELYDAFTKQHRNPQ